MQTHTNNLDNIGVGTDVWVDLLNCEDITSFPFIVVKIIYLGKSQIFRKKWNKNNLL